MFPKQKVKVTFVLLFTLLTLLKWSVDVCLPNVEGSQVFPIALTAPDFVCVPLRNWDMSARSSEAVSQSQRNFYNPAPTMLDTDRSGKGLFFFNKDILKLTVMLARIPKEPVPLLQLTVLTVILSIIFGIVWEVIENVVLTPVDYEGPPTKSKHAILRDSSSSRTILPTYLTEKPRIKPSGNRASIFKPRSDEDET